MMKYAFGMSLLLVMTFLTSSCVCKKSADKSNSELGKTIGIVSHQYRSGGCKTVIIVNDAQGNEIVLIPKDPLPSKLDKDQLKIRFDYTTLKMPNPKGCGKGIPAVITNVQKEK